MKKKAQRSPYRQLTRENRYQIAALLEVGKSEAEIAAVLGMHRSTIYREVDRGSVKPRSAPRGQCSYKAGWAHKTYLVRRNLHRYQFGHPRGKIQGSFGRRIIEKLWLGWSPQQISERLKLEGHPVTVSHESIYRYLVMDKRNGGRLYHLLRQYGHHRKRYGRKRRLKAPMGERRSIEERSMDAEQRLSLGHWERDLMIGKQSGGAVLTIVDRKSRYSLLRYVPSRKPSDVLTATLDALSNRHGLDCHSITNDNGFEFMDHPEVTRNLGVPVFFAHPYSSWERGTVENTNGLLRQYCPKGESLEFLTPERLAEIQTRLNLRPRRTLGYLTPEEAQFGTKRNLFSPHHHM